MSTRTFETDKQYWVLVTIKDIVPAPDPEPEDEIVYDGALTFEFDNVDYSVAFTDSITSIDPGVTKTTTVYAKTFSTQAEKEDFLQLLEDSAEGFGEDTLLSVGLFDELVGFTSPYEPDVAWIVMLAEAVLVKADVEDVRVQSSVLDIPSFDLVNGGITLLSDPGTITTAPVTFSIQENDLAFTLPPEGYTDKLELRIGGEWTLYDPEPPVLEAPVVTNAGTITSAGTLGEIGSVHTVTGFTYTGSEETVTYQWRRDTVAISGATSETYTPVEADDGTNLTRTTTVTNASGSDSDTTAAQAITAAPEGEPGPTPSYLGRSRALSSTAQLAVPTAADAATDLLVALCSRGEAIGAYPAGVTEVGHADLSADIDSRTAIRLVGGAADPIDFPTAAYGAHYVLGWRGAGEITAVAHALTTDALTENRLVIPSVDVEVPGSTVVVLVYRKNTGGMGTLDVNITPSITDIYQNGSSRDYCFHTEGVSEFTGGTVTPRFSNNFDASPYLVTVVVIAPEIVFP